MINLNDIERLAKAATPGPWSSKYLGTAYPEVRYVYKPESVRVPYKTMVVASCWCDIETNDPPYRDNRDAHYIAAANPETVLLMAKAIRAGQKVVDPNAPFSEYENSLLALRAALEPFKQEGGK